MNEIQLNPRDYSDLLLIILSKHFKILNKKREGKYYTQLIIKHKAEKVGIYDISAQIKPIFLINYIVIDNIILRTENMNATMIYIENNKPIEYIEKDFYLTPYNYIDLFTDSSDSSDSDSDNEYENEYINLVENILIKQETLSPDIIYPSSYIIVLYSFIFKEVFSLDIRDIQIITDQKNKEQALEQKKEQKGKEKQNNKMIIHFDPDKRTHEHFIGFLEL